MCVCVYVYMYVCTYVTLLCSKFRIFFDTLFVRHRKLLQLVLEQPQLFLDMTELLSVQSLANLLKLLRCLLVSLHSAYANTPSSHGLVVNPSQLANTKQVLFPIKY